MGAWSSGLPAVLETALSSWTMETWREGWEKGPGQLGQGVGSAQGLGQLLCMLEQKHVNILTSGTVT